MRTSEACQQAAPVCLARPCACMADASTCQGVRPSLQPSPVCFSRSLASISVPDYPTGWPDAGNRWFLCTFPCPAAARQMHVPACSWDQSAAADCGPALNGPACIMQAVQKRAAGGHTLPHQTLLLRDKCMYQPGGRRQLAAGTTLPRLTAQQAAQTAAGAGCTTWPACRQVCMVSV